MTQTDRDADASTAGVSFDRDRAQNAPQEQQETQRSQCRIDTRSNQTGTERTPPDAPAGVDGNGAFLSADAADPKREGHPASQTGRHSDPDDRKGGKRRRRRQRGAQRKSAAKHGASDAQRAHQSDAETPASSGREPAVSGIGAEASHQPLGDPHKSVPGSKSRKRRRRRKRQSRPVSPSQAVAHSNRADGNGAPTSGDAPTSPSASTKPTAAGAARPAGAPQRKRETGGPYYAALDLGTNNCRLLVAAPTRPGQFRVIDAFSRIVRLGEGLGATGKLSQAAMDRAVEALAVCAHKLSDKPIRKARLIATEACRAAENGEAFLARVKRETGLDLEIVDRETEARLAVSGCSSLVGQETDSVVLFDIGGGSSEIAVIELPEKRSGRLANHIRAWTSLPVGVVTLSERFGGRDVTPEIFDAMVAHVEVLLDAFLAPPLPGMAGVEGGGRFHLIGTSGTVTTLAGVHLGLPRYDRRRVDGLWLTSGEVDRMLDTILSWDFAQRSANPCIGAERADLVLAGCAILQGIRRRWPADRMRVADRGLREGLLTDMMAADGVWRRGRRRYPSRAHQQGAPRTGTAS